MNLWIGCIRFHSAKIPREEKNRKRKANTTDRLKLTLSRPTWLILGSVPKRLGCCTRSKRTSSQSRAVVHSLIIRRHFMWASLLKYCRLLFLKPTLCSMSCVRSSRSSSKSARLMQNSVTKTCSRSTVPTLRLSAKS